MDVGHDGEFVEDTLKACHGNDFDLEIFKASPDQVLDALKAVGIDLELAGAAFPVYRVCGCSEIQISYPRLEECTGDKHTDFKLTVDPEMSFKAAALRRDFTVNALGWNWRTHKLHDPYGGLGAIIHRELIPVSHKFTEDALRVLRAFKFIGRLGYTPSSATLHFCSALIPKLRTYARERILGEWEDFILRADSQYVKPAFDFLQAIGACDLYPELFDLRGVEQDPDHHPEGDVFKHTTHVFEEYCSIRNAIQDRRDKLVVGWAALAHDVGKTICTAVDDFGKISAPGHEDTILARLFLERFYDTADSIIDEVDALVMAHMRPVGLYKDRDKLAGYSAVKRLSRAVDGRVDRLVHLVYCDQLGRPGKVGNNLEALNWLIDQAKAANGNLTDKIQPIIKGRHLIEHLSMAPGPKIGVLLKEIFEAQLDEKFNDETTGVAFLKANYQK